MLRISLVALIAASSLAGCKPTDVGPGAATAESRELDRQRAEIRAHPVKMPPSIASSAQYRCADNSLLLVDWMSDGLTARVSTVREGPQVALLAPASGAPKVAQGWSLTGSAVTGPVTVSTPGHPKAMACKG